MNRSLIPQGFWDWPRFPSLMDEDWFSLMPDRTSGLEVSEDDSHVTVKAHVPGID